MCRDMENYSVRSMAGISLHDDGEQLSGPLDVHRVVIGISVVIGFIVIFQAMYTAVMERTREIGILKSIGASKLYIVNVILRETVLLAIGGIVVGVLFSLAARAGIHVPLAHACRWSLPADGYCGRRSLRSSARFWGRCIRRTRRRRRIRSTRWPMSSGLQTSDV